jgi:hypothetical protein
MPTPHASTKTETYKPSEPRMAGGRRQDASSRNGSTVAVGPLAAWMRVSEEATRFASQRMEKNIEMARALSRCTNPMEMWTAWTEAAQMMARDYAEGIARMGETYADAAAATRMPMDMADMMRTRAEAATEAAI